MEIIFPSNIYCINCNEPISRENKYSMCKSCYDKIEFLKDKNTNYDREVMKILERKYIKSVDIVAIYKTVMKDMIIKLKYEDATFISRYFARMIYDYIIEKNIEFDYIISTPIHKNRYKKRGYNQIELIVKYLSKLSRKKEIKIAKRIKDTKDMYQLSLKDRQNEMKDAFLSTEEKDIDSKTLLVIDDVLTTGSTVGNLCREIRRKNKNTKFRLLFLSRPSMK